MNYVEIKQQLTKELNDLKEQLDSLKKTKSNYPDLSKKSNRYEYFYKLTLAKISKVSELLEILDFQMLLNSNKHDNLKFQKEFLKLFNDFVAVAKEKKMDLDSLRSCFKKEKEELLKTDTSILLEKEKLELDKKIESLTHFISLIDIAKRSFNTNDSNAVIIYIEKMICSLNNKTAEEVKEFRKSRVSDKLYAKNEYLQSNVLEKNGNFRLFEGDFGTVKNISSIASEFIDLYQSLKNSSNTSIFTTTEIPISFQNEILDLDIAKMYELPNLISHVELILKRNSKLQNSFINLFSVPNVINLKEDFSFKQVDKSYLELLDKYSKYNVFEKDFIKEKRKNYSEYKGLQVPTNAFYRLNPNLLICRLGEDFEEIRCAIIDYLLSCSSKYYNIGISYEDIEDLLHTNDIFEIQQKIKCLYKKTKDYCTKCINYYNELIQQNIEYKNKVESKKARLNYLNSQFFLEIHHDLDINTAKKISSINGICDLMGDLYQQKLFNKLFTIKNNKVNKK